MLNHPSQPQTVWGSEEASRQMYGPSNCTPQPQTLWGNEEAPRQMCGLSNYPSQPQTVWGNKEAPRQMYGLSNYPSQPQTLWGNEALRQMPKRLPQLRVAPLTCKDKSFLQSSEDIATSVGWGKFQVAYQQSQVLTQEVAQSTDVDAMMRAIQAKPASDSSSEAAAGKKRARAQDAGSGGENGRGGGVESANAREYKCYFGECQKAFTQKAQMKIHIRVHTGETPYVRPPTSPLSTSYPQASPANLLPTGMHLPLLHARLLPTRQPQNPLPSAHRRTPLRLSHLRQNFHSALPPKNARRCA
jgi:hypothetical protein